MAKVTHIWNSRTARDSIPRTVCGLETGRVLAQARGAKLATVASQATCKRCRKIEGR